MATAVMDDWVFRVLGVAVAGAGDAGATARPEANPGGWEAAMTEWRQANETVDGQIEALRARLMQTDDEDLEDIAEYGLNAITGNNRVRTMAALQEVGAGTPDLLRKAGPKALPVIDAFVAHLDGSEEVAVCDDNPFGVKMSIRATLGGALRGLAAVLRAQA